MSKEVATRVRLIERAAQIWAQALAAQALAEPSDAARAAGCRTEHEVAAWIAAYRAPHPQAA